MVAPYASVDFALSIAGLSQQTNRPVNYDRQKLLNNLRIVSRRVDKVFHSDRPVFAPYIETRKVALDGYHVNSAQGTFRFDGYLLELDGSLTINGTTVSGVEAYPDSNMPPFSQLRLTGDCASWYSQVCAGCAPLQVSIPGVWGIHSDYAHAWLVVDALAANIANATVTTFTVADVDGADAYGNTPRISPGHLLRIGDEYLEVTATDTNTNTVTVIRGAHGSTATTHTQTDAVSVWRVEDPIRWAVARQAGLMYARFGAYTTVEVNGMSEIRYPADFLQEVYGVLNHYAYR